MDHSKIGMLVCHCYEVQNRAPLRPGLAPIAALLLRTAVQKLIQPTKQGIKPKRAVAVRSSL